MSGAEQAWISIVYLLLVAYVGWFALRRMDRSFWTWAGLSILVSPPLALLFLLFIGPPSKEAERKGPP